jgi:hypothetical protein
MLHGRLRTLAILSGAFLLAAGCVSPVLNASRQGPPTVGKVSLYPNRDGLGSIAMRVIDERNGYGTQAVQDADDWSEVRVLLSSPTALKADKFDVVAGSNAQLTYSSQALQELPPANDYRLLVALASGSAILGQGATESVAVAPGTTTPVTIYINAVGNVSFDHPVYHVRTFNFDAMGFPEVLAGSTVSVKTNFPMSESNPVDQIVSKFAFELRDASGSIKVASTSVNAPVFPSAASPSVLSEGTASVSLPPLPAGNNNSYFHATVFGLNSADKVLTTKSRKILLLRGGTINATLN